MDDEERLVKAESQIALWRTRNQLHSAVGLMLCTAVASIFRLFAPKDAPLFYTLRPWISWLLAALTVFFSALWFRRGHLHMKFLDDRMRGLGHLTPKTQDRQTRTWTRHVLLAAVFNPGFIVGGGWVYMGLRRNDGMLIAAGTFIAFGAVSASLKNLYLYHQDLERS